MTTTTTHTITDDPNLNTLLVHTKVYQGGNPVIIRFEVPRNDETALHTGMEMARKSCLTHLKQEAGG